MWERKISSGSEAVRSDARQAERMAQGRRTMLARSIALAALAAVAIGGAVNRADAMGAGPVTALPEYTTDALIQDVRWVCGPYRCEWQPLAIFAPEPPRHTRAWRQPRTPGCYYERRRGRWREVCPK
jgi:hypothetical protein